MPNRKYLASLLQLISITGLSCAISQAREYIDLNDGWKFALADQPRANDPEFDDTRWRTLSVPHDWAFEAEYAPDAAQTDRGGYKPGGIGWYRREIEMLPAWIGKAVRIEFDGVYMNSQIWLNGKRIGGRAYGYISFGFDLAHHLKPGRNVLAVRVDNSREPSARWYHGCGIYARVKLVITDPIRIAPWGVFVQTPLVSQEKAEVNIATTLAIDPPQNARLTTVLLDPQGRKVSEAKTRIQNADTSQTLSIENPQLWDTDSPKLYTAVSQVRLGNRIVDTVETRFGIREIRWETETGFWLNGRNIKLKGVADHLEAGPVGAAYPESLLRWKIQKLKTMGVNAIRVAHNPQTPAFYDICDELGMMVMDEIFDGWTKKAAEDYGARFFATDWERDLRDWLRRDRNHPSIIIYSVGNETRGSIAPELVRVCHEMDPTRLVTSGHAGSEHMDVYGVNGHSEKQTFFQKKRPDKPFVATEAPHTWQVRGYYRTQTWWRDGYPNKRQAPFPLEDLTEEEIFRYDWAPATAKTSAKQVFNSSYDNATVRISARKNWELLRDLPWYAGHFRWTGFDYLGEAGYVHGGWPFRAFMGGALDLAGFEKDLYYFYQSQWTREPMVHLLPHWTHPKMELGTEIPVWAYSNADEVELFLNGRSLGRDKPGIKAEEMQCEWLVPWEPGTIEAVAYRDGQEVARTRHTTANAPEKLRIDFITTDDELGCDDVAIVTVAQEDGLGNFYPYGENRMAFHLDGPARILSLENGNPIDTEPNFGQTARRAFFGLNRAFIQATEETGPISVMVGAINGERRHLTSDRVSIDVQQIALRGGMKDGRFEIFYTIDGSEPTTKSEPYRKPFSVSLGSTVRALILKNGAEVFTLEESFAKDVGIHWLAEDESSTVMATGLQAEDAILRGGATIGHDVSGHYGTGFARLPRHAQVELYQENDGSFGLFALRIRYQSNQASRVAVKVNQNTPQIIDLPASPDDWRQVMLRARLQNGGNVIVVETQDGGPILFDELEVSSNF